jgi:hypothetical protein
VFPFREIVVERFKLSSFSFFFHPSAKKSFLLSSNDDSTKKDVESKLYKLAGDSKFLSRETVAAASDM